MFSDYNNMWIEGGKYSTPILNLFLTKQILDDIYVCKI